MFKNYFFLNRIITELNDQFKGFTLRSIFSQEKDTLIFEITDFKRNYFLEISVNPGFPYINIRHNFHRAKKNTIDFFRTVLPSKITGFSIAATDRVIKIELEDSPLFFIVRGKHTNVFQLSAENELDAFKKINEKEAKDFIYEFKHLTFYEHFNLPQMHLPPDIDFFTYMKVNYPFVGKEILAEVRFRTLNISF